MPIHDWTKVHSGTFHAFHLAWIAEIQAALNAGLLPDGFYAQAEQQAGPYEADVLALERVDGGQSEAESPGGVAVAEVAPQTRLVDEADAFYDRKQNRIAIRHVTGDRPVALLEIVSPGNKSSRTAVEDFAEKAEEALRTGHHLVVIDPFPPGKYDPNGMFGAVWAAFGREYSPPPDRPLTLAGIQVKAGYKAYIEPTRVGEALADIPLFFTPVRYVNVPLEPTYTRAYRSVPQRWRSVIEG